MATSSTIPEPLASWATKAVWDHYATYLIYMQLLSKELEFVNETILKIIEAESNRRLEIIRKALNSPPADSLFLEANR